MRILSVTALVAALALSGCGASVNPALKSSIDKRILAFPSESDNVYDAPTSAEPMPIGVGQWARYKLMDTEGNPALVTYKVVGEDAGAYWLETVRETYQDKQVMLTLVDMGNRKDLDGVEVRALKQKIDDNSPTEYPSALLGMMKALWKPMLENMVVDWNGKQQDDARVPAGVFNQCYQAYVTVSLLGSSETSHMWSHPAVPMSGTVRSQSVDSTSSMTLLEFGLEGAESEIGI
jgi:hypothetical protein